jgi:hypothetical protein
MGDPAERRAHGTNEPTIAHHRAERATRPVATGGKRSTVEGGGELTSAALRAGRKESGR